MLLLLHAVPGEVATTELGSHLHRSGRSLDVALAALERAGLVSGRASDGRRMVRLERADSRAAAVDDLARLYPHWRARIVSTILSG